MQLPSANLARRLHFGGIRRNACTESRRLITRRSQVQILPPILERPRKRGLSCSVARSAETFAQLLPELGGVFGRSGSRLGCVTAAAGIVRPYDPGWPHSFEAERTVLIETLSRWLDGDLEHVGSTSVPGLAAKPVIDMIAPVRDLEAARGAFGPLRALGYGHRDHRPEAHAFHKPASSLWWQTTHSLHLTERGSDIWRERLAFRDALRASPVLAAEFQNWKVRAARDARADSPYAADKFEFVARVLAEAGIKLNEDVDRLSPEALAQRHGLTS
jgi:GrpB-like predicted nucleotidyltransferase (UPF0157 family)